MNKIAVMNSQELGESTFTTTLPDGLEVYISKRQGFSKKIGMFGTKYGSVDNDFIDINTNNMTCISDLNEELKEKKVTNIFNIGNGNFQEDYIAIILEGDKAYYATQNLQELINININGFPELHLKMS